MPRSAIPEADPEAAPATSAQKPAGSKTSGTIKRTPELEAALGARIRAARIAAGMNQTQLGAAVGISFQQVQKYENGRDRVAASTLQGIAAALGVHPGTFFGDELAVPLGDTKPVREAMAVAADWQRIRNPETRKGLAKLVATLAGESQAKPESEG